MRRREFITLLGGAASWSLYARAQQPERVRRIGVLIGTAENDAEAQARLAVFRSSLERLGWRAGQNFKIDYRYTDGDASRIRTLAKEIVALKPDVIVVSTGNVAVAVHAETRTIPIVFVVVIDPIGSGLVSSLSNPGGNVTGFINHEKSLGSKWAELLKEIAPGTRRMAIMFNPDTVGSGAGLPFWNSFETAARTLGIEPVSAIVHSTSEIEKAIAMLGREPGNGFVVAPDSFTFIHRGAIISSTREVNLPAIYYGRLMAAEGGLISYGVDSVDLYRRAGPYVHRILNGENPSELPVQLPTKFELVINLKTAKTLGLTVPPSLLATADEVIE